MQKELNEPEHIFITADQTSLKDITSGKHVIAGQPTAVCSFTSSKNGKAELEKLFKGSKLLPLWVPYANSGSPLTQKTDGLIKDYQNQYGKKPQIIFFEKHGLIVSADSSNAAMQTASKIVKRCESKLKKIPNIKIKSLPASVITETAFAIRKAFLQTAGKYTPIHYFCDNEIAFFIKSKLTKKLLSYSTITPSELMCINSSPMWLDDSNPEKIVTRFNARIKNNQNLPKAFLVKGIGLFIACENSQQIKGCVKNSLVIRKNASAIGGISALTTKQQNFLNNLRGKDSCESGLELKNRIAIVTGAGSGLGRSIAMGLARAGALVAIADIDTAAAQETAQVIANELPSSKTIVVQCNVTDETSVNTAFENLAKEWGGLDILVNAAGVAPAGALIDIPVDKWRFALEVNLTGYFLMARAAAKIMIKQNMGGAIINLSSKSGLDASKNNTPYNATKAGELHMARGWAMELGEYGIRVNCVCPGNVFEGSKIWNPHYIKVCAQKYGIKPEEVIPFYVNKTFLKREIKGRDIADAVVFLCSDKSRTITGQTIVADSGQVMVR